MSPSLTSRNAQTIRFTVNGNPCEIDTPPTQKLLDVLRDELKLKGSRFGCGANECGACSVLIEGQVQPSCDTPMWAVEGRRVVTVEGLYLPGLPQGLREAFVTEQAAQCGYCTSGMLIGAAALLMRLPDPSEAEVRSALEGCLCRCGTHNRVVRAVLRAAEGAAHSSRQSELP